MMRLVPRAAWPVLLSLLLLTGCGSMPPSMRLAPRPPVPPSLLSCPVQPAPPPATADDAALGDFILDLASAGDECRRKLDAVKGILAQ